MAKIVFPAIKVIDVYDIDDKTKFLFTLKKYPSDKQSCYIWVAENKEGNKLAEKQFMEHSKIEQIRFAFKKELKMI